MYDFTPGQEASQRRYEAAERRFPGLNAWAEQYAVQPVDQCEECGADDTNEHVNTCSFLPIYDPVKE